MTLGQVIQHLQARDMVVVNLRNHIVSFRPPALYGVKFAGGRIFVGRPPGGTGAATLTRVELDREGLGDRDAARRRFYRTARRFAASLREVARRSVFPRRQRVTEGIVPQARWVWVCGPKDRVRLTLQYARDESPAAQHRYRIHATWRFAPKAAAPGRPGHTRFEPLSAGVDRGALRRLLLDASRKWQDHARRYQLSFLSNGRAVIVGGDGETHSYAGRWRITGRAPALRVELALRDEGFYTPSHRYRPGRCQVRGQGTMPCLQGTAPPQLPYWYAR